MPTNFISYTSFSGFLFLLLFLLLADLVFVGATRRGKSLLSTQLCFVLCFSKLLKFVSSVNEITLLIAIAVWQQPLQIAVAMTMEK